MGASHHALYRSYDIKWEKTPQRPCIFSNSHECRWNYNFHNEDQAESNWELTGSYGGKKQLLEKGRRRSQVLLDVWLSLEEKRGSRSYTWRKQQKSRRLLWKALRLSAHAHQCCTWMSDLIAEDITHSEHRAWRTWCGTKLGASSVRTSSNSVRC